MARRKQDRDKFLIEEFPTEILCAEDKLVNLSEYKTFEKGVMFEGGVEYRLVVVLGKLTEEPENGGD